MTIIIQLNYHINFLGGIKMKNYLNILKMRRKFYVEKSERFLLEVFKDDEVIFPKRFYTYDDACSYIHNACSYSYPYYWYISEIVFLEGRTFI